jgi:hypothetical protein
MILNILRIIMLVARYEMRVFKLLCSGTLFIVLLYLVFSFLSYKLSTRKRMLKIDVFMYFLFLKVEKDSVERI